MEDKRTKSGKTICFSRGETFMLWGCILASGVGKFLQADATQTMMMMTTEKYSQITHVNLLTGNGLLF